MFRGEQRVRVGRVGSRGEASFAYAQLAALAVLEAAADIAVVALLAAHPDDDALDDDALQDRRAARVLVDAARDVAACVNRYRLALVVTRQRRRDDLLPF